MADEHAHPAEAPHANPARAIYGTILVMAVIAALSHDDSVQSAELVAGVLATTFVFWIAHVYSEVLGSRIEGEGGAPRCANVAVAARGEWPLVEASLLPVLCLLVGGARRSWKTETAVSIAIGAGVVELFGYGIAAGRSCTSQARHHRGGRGQRRPRPVIVLLKVLVH